jgi:hypothetical protein
MKQLFTLGIDGGTQYHSDFESTKGNVLFLDEKGHESMCVSSIQFEKPNLDNEIVHFLGYTKK